MQTSVSEPRLGLGQHQSNISLLMANHNHKSSRQSISDAVHTARQVTSLPSTKGMMLNRVLPSAATITPVDSKDVSKVLVSGHPPAHSTKTATAIGHTQHKQINMSNNAQHSDTRHVQSLQSIDSLKHQFTQQSTAIQLRNQSTHSQQSSNDKSKPKPHRTRHQFHPGIYFQRGRVR